MSEPEVEIKEWVRKPTDEYPMGSYLRTTGGKVDVATGFYEKEHPGHPSPLWHGGPPFVLFNCGSGEMDILWWSNASNPVGDSLPEMHPCSEQDVPKNVLDSFRAVYPDIQVNTEDSDE